MENRWFVLSRLIGQFKLNKNIIYLRHVLGKRAVIVDEHTFNLIQFYQLPHQGKKDIPEKVFNLLINEKRENP